MPRLNQDIAPVDPNVVVPARVKAAAKAAETIHQQSYPDADPPPADAVAAAPADIAPATPEPTPAPAPRTRRAAAPPAPPVDAIPPADPQAAPPDTQTAEQWRHRFLSMQGRYTQAAQSLGSMQEQMQEMGDELIRAQQQLGRGVPAPRNQAPSPPAPLLTPEEVQSYGPELIDVIQRAARQAIAPELQHLQGNLQHSVREVQQRVQKVTAGSLYQQLDQQIPEWRTINVDPRFKTWCNSPDVYSNQLRGRLLNAAFQAGDASRVIAFFNGFLSEERATGQLPEPQPIPQPPLAPREPAVALDMLTVPGRAKPAGGNNPLPADKPIFTRTQISAFYNAVRQGHYNGREAEKSAMEQAIFAAQNEGRVR